MVVSLVGLMVVKMVALRVVVLAVSGDALLADEKANSWAKLKAYITAVLKAASLENEKVHY